MLKDPKKTKDEIVQWIRNYFRDNGPGRSAVIGISGGKDSTIAAALCVEALGKESVIGVLMPNGIQSDIQDSYKVVESLGINYHVVNIGDTVFALTDQLESIIHVSEQTRVNMPARIRMTTLYAIAQSLPNGGRVVNTCNRSEDFVGYSTKFGDSAGDFSPLANLMVHEVIQIGHELPIPVELVDKTPSDGLCGKTDEDNLGFTYAQLDDYITHGTCGIMSIDNKIEVMHRQNLHKLQPMPYFGQ
nr:NAD(+) synthase [Acutalibacter muris]